MHIDVEPICTDCETSNVNKYWFLPSNDTCQFSLKFSLPGRCTILVQGLEITSRYQFAAVHTGLNGAQAAQGPHLRSKVHEWGCRFS